METRLSTKGQLIIPKEIRERVGWRAGSRLLLEQRGDYLIIRLAADVPPADIDSVVGCTGYRGRRKSLRDMERAIARGARGQR